MSIQITFKHNTHDAMMEQQTKMHNALVGSPHISIAKLYCVKIRTTRLNFLLLLAKIMTVMSRWISIFGPIARVVNVDEYQKNRGGNHPYFLTIEKYFGHILLI